MSMIIQSLLGSTIVETAATKLLLSLTPTDKLTSEKQLSKIALIEARNRVLKSLIQLSEELPEEKRKLLKEKITIVINFFNTIGKAEEEAKSAKLGMLQVIQKSIEGPIPAAILLSLKEDKDCTEEELNQKKADKEMRDKILKRAFEMAEESDTLLKHLNDLMILLKN